jgi:hypothetical protein
LVSTTGKKEARATAAVDGTAEVWNASGVEVTFYRVGRRGVGAVKVG